MRESFLTLTSQVTSVSECLTSDYRPRDLHHFRIRIRRIRSLLKQVSYLQAQYFRETWGGFAAITNQARDWDVFLKAAGKILPEAKYREFRSIANPIVRASHETVIEFLQWQQHLADWMQFIGSFDERDITDDGPTWSVESALAKVRTRYILARVINDERVWHKFRIAVKQLRYIADASIGDPSCDQAQLAEVIAACKKLQTRLGKWHDAVVQLHMVRDQLVADEQSAVAMKSELTGALQQLKVRHLSKVRATLAEQTLFST
jgi:CHAD domain-containing protein